jgi:UDPglucose--hexose-1-phosphate uridylyltransferase
VSAAPEWRSDPLTGRRVLIAPTRADRPIGIRLTCPFCEGHEAETPPEVSAVRPTGSLPNGPGWQVRVVPNRYAALQPLPPAPSPKRGGGVQTQTPPLLLGEGAGGRGSATGVAEVFLESPHHETKFRNLPPDQAAIALRTWRDRLRHWRADGRLVFAQVFKNEGPGAGASVQHCHSQLIGVPFVPPLVAEELAACSSEPCAFCRWIESEIGGPRFVAESGGFVVLCPVAPRFPGETWVLPRLHAARFEDAPDADLGRLAGVLLDHLRRTAAFGDPDLNLIVKSAPFRYDGLYHWRIEVLPRFSSGAGWEWATGLMINTMFPERAAQMLRSGEPAA